MRLPWETVGVSDPSSRQALVVAPDGRLSTVTVHRMALFFAAGRDVIHADYLWPKWQVATYHERPKAGLDVFASSVARVGRG
jgi:hypothetical protein